MRFDIVLNNLVARAFVAALEADADAIRGEAFNVCRTENNYQVKDPG